MDTKHTPGPWAVGPWFDNDGQPEIIIEHVTPHGNLVPAVALGGLFEQEANARLIAAAPDLLQAAQQAADALNGAHGKQVRLRVRDALLQAIAKATGAAA